VDTKTACDLDCQELAEKVASGEAALAGVRGDQAHLDCAVAATEAKMEAVRPKVSAELQREETANAEIGEVNRRLQVLHQRQGRGSQFKTKQERDAWLKEQVADCESTLGRKRDEIGILDRDVTELTKSATREKKNEHGIKGKLVEEIATLGESEEEYGAKIARRNAAQDERKELQRADAETDAELSSKTEEVKRRDKQLEFTMPRELFRGLSAVQRIVKDHGIQGVHGPLIGTAFPVTQIPSPRLPILAPEGTVITSDCLRNTRYERLTRPLLFIVRADGVRRAFLRRRGSRGDEPAVPRRGG
jgi:structural maintenance of chromosome 3 (chondroitin sulfate proteoglycan 6)